MIAPATLLASLLLATSMQPADTPKEQAETKVAEKEAEDDSKMICRRTAVTGSKFKKRICATKYEWEKLRERSQDTTREFQNNKGLEPVN